MFRPPLFPTIEKGDAVWLTNADMGKAVRTDLEANLLRLRTPRETIWLENRRKSRGGRDLTSQSACRTANSLSNPTLRLGR